MSPSVLALAPAFSSSALALSSSASADFISLGPHLVRCLAKLLVGGLQFCLILAETDLAGGAVGIEQRHLLRQGRAGIVQRSIHHGIADAQHHHLH